MIDDSIASVFASPVAAELYARELRDRGFDATAFFDEGGR